MERAHTINTGSVPTRITFAVVDILFTEFACETCLAFAGEGVHEIEAFSTVFARVTATVVDVDLTVCTVEAHRTTAFISVDLINADTRSTRVGITLVDIIFTSNTSVS